MTNLPVIVGFGGINPAGRSSFHHGYRRLVFDALSAEKAQLTLNSLAPLMGLDHSTPDGATATAILQGTLIRQIERGILDVSAADYNQKIILQNSESAPLTFELAMKQLPASIPESWRLETIDDQKVRVHIVDQQTLLVPSQRELKVQAAGQLPSGFDPGANYSSHNHPRGLQMTVFGASDALASVGIDWDVLSQAVVADQVSVYAGSGMSQLDANANGGMMSARFNGKRATSKQCPFGFAEMPADFINAYILGSLGTTGTSMGACASFLYNLRQGITDIQSGRSRIAIVGNSEAPILPEIIEGYSAMSALATDKELRQLDNNGVLDYRRACRPFGENCGFTLAESAQFIVLFDDSLALELGAKMYGAVTDVFINADGHKKSISAPGVGNYLTVAKAMASARGLLGEESLQKRSFIQAHGTGTPQNRVTESEILNRAADVFGIDSWPVVAVKSYLGHSVSVAGADQLVASLGVWEEGILPGINTIDGPADDVACSHLDISNHHKEVGAQSMDAAIINAKGFGGNNASATVIAPHIVEKIVAGKHKSSAWSTYQSRAEQVQEHAKAYDQAMLSGEAKPTYRFDHNVLSGDSLAFDDKSIKVPGYAEPIDLNITSEYKKWLD
ncbi:MAG: beta-ketoacyl synthase [Pseudomonadales bacterium]|nr:beta-ketoacyl synthase [Pseudomonadales bacterium]